MRFINSIKLSHCAQFMKNPAGRQHKVVTILVIAALLFGFQGLDSLLSEFGRDSGVLQK